MIDFLGVLLFIDALFYLKMAWLADIKLIIYINYNATTQI
ncbi:hypothetical protein HMPREF0693_0271 [Proteus mirabilis ATCC 29906]|nr:hypothetical protein BB2000_3033 [Proteus mirabilis BB2000]AWF40658.1 hypothetical protein CSC16_3487 [Proteus mirabilis]EEI49603.1 hypothetical protein HMPREF0693_0271 [Proteus mirabilis ATCC 29906]KXC01929.1 hypothetical protein HMPREF3203_00523 [Proteus mirabilis]PVF70946.1 hypothetical protein CSC14_0262 [Proteus mirabilis]